MPKHISGTAAGKTHLLNIFMLIAGYGFGQGSIFLAQTWLVAQGNLELLALFGTHFSFAMLGIILVEAGSLTILARHAALMTHDSNSAPAMWRTFWETGVFRAILAMLTIAAIAIWLVITTPGDFSRNYAIFAAPAYLIWSVNAAGFLDGLKLSGISGLTGSIAYVASAIALLLSVNLASSTAGIVLGCAFSAGYALTVTIQMIALHRVGWKLRFEWPQRAGIARSAREGLALLGSTLPGQLYFRAQLLMSTVWLGADITALFIYVKQIIVGFAQLIGFVRRVEFPDLVGRLAQNTDNRIATIFAAQRKGTILATGATVLLILAGLLLMPLMGNEFAETGPALALFALIVLSSAFSLALTQGLMALGRYTALSGLIMAASVAGLFASLIFSRWLGLPGFMIADVIVHALTAFVAISLIRKAR